MPTNKYTKAFEEWWKARSIDEFLKELVYSAWDAGWDKGYKVGIESTKNYFGNED